MSLPHALLGLLADGPASGYDLLKRFDGTLAFVWPATQSQLYTELGKLDRDGMVAVAAHGPRGRKEYEITDEGRAELHRWLTDTEPERARRNEATLRVFFLASVSPDEARAYLEREAEVAAQQLETFREIANSCDWSTMPAWVRFSRVALEQGLRVTESTAGWAQWAIDQVDAIADGAESGAGA
jgi:DNA-binding PadR family transcriptional regulator